MLYSSDGRALIFSTAQLAVKTTRATQGVAVMTLRKNKILEQAIPLEESTIQNQARYRVRSLPAAGAILRPEDAPEPQLTL